MLKNCEKKLEKCWKKYVEKIGKNQKKSKKIEKKIRKNQKKSLKNNQLYLYICIYVISAIFDQSWKKKKKKIEKYF